MFRNIRSRRGWSALLVGWSNVEHGYGVGTAGFGLVSLGVIAVLGVIVLAALWVAQYPHWRRALTRVGGLTPVRCLWDWTTARLGPPTSSLRARWRLPGIAGVVLVAGLLIVTVMAVGFTDLLDDVLEGDGLAIVDQPAARWLAQHRDVWLTQILIPISRGGGPAGQTVWLVLVCALAAACGRSWLPVVIGATTAAASPRWCSPRSIWSVDRAHPSPSHCCPRGVSPFRLVMPPGRRPLGCCLPGFCADGWFDVGLHRFQCGRPPAPRSHSSAFPASTWGSTSSPMCWRAGCWEPPGRV